MGGGQPDPDAPPGSAAPLQQAGIGNAADLLDVAADLKTELKAAVGAVVDQSSDQVRNDLWPLVAGLGVLGLTAVIGLAVYMRAQVRRYRYLSEKPLWEARVNGWDCP